MKFVLLFAYCSSFMAAASPSNHAENEDASRQTKMIRGSGVLAAAALSTSTNKKPKTRIADSDASAGDEELKDILKNLYMEYGSESFWHNAEVMQYEVQITRPKMPDFVLEPGYVSSIPPIPEEEKEAFHEEYMLRTKRDWHDKMEPLEMLKCQFDRLEWVQENPDILVNQLRENSFTDDEIEGIFTGTMPNGFQSREDWSAFAKDLNTRAAECLAKQTDLKNIVFEMGGSSATGYSTNPYKGKCSIPTWITSRGASDMDILIVADNVASVIAKTGIEKYLTFEAQIDRFSQSTRYVIGTHKKGAEQKTAAGDYNSEGGAATDYNAPNPSNVVDLESQRQLGVDAYPGYVRYYDILGDCFGEFWNEWEDKTTLAIQFILQENKFRVPGWQFKIDDKEEEEEEEEEE